MTTAPLLLKTRDARGNIDGRQCRSAMLATSVLDLRNQTNNT